MISLGWELAALLLDTSPHDGRFDWGRRSEDLISAAIRNSCVRARCVHREGVGDAAELVQPRSSSSDCGRRIELFLFRGDLTPKASFNFENVPGGTL